MNWYVKHFTDSEVAELKEKTKIKNDQMQYNNLSKDYGTRWIGIAGELAFKEYLDKAGTKYKHHFSWTEKDVADFTTGPLRIDVKTAARSFDPRPDWSCDVAAVQMEKIVKQKIINMLVFASYNLKTNVCTILGKMAWDTFLLESEEIKKGDMLPNNNPTPAPATLYHVPIGYLEPLKYVDNYLVDNWVVV